jgi:hypothetical protein
MFACNVQQTCTVRTQAHIHVQHILIQRLGVRPLQTVYARQVTPGSTAVSVQHVRSVPTKSCRVITFVRCVARTHTPTPPVLLIAQCVIPTHIP